MQQYKQRRNDPIAHVFVVVFFVALFSVIGAGVAANRVASKHFNNAAVLGPRFPVIGYQPLSLLIWESACRGSLLSPCNEGPATQKRVLALFNSENKTLFLFVGIGAALGLLMGIAGARKDAKQQITVHGDSRWATFRDYAKAGMLVGLRRPSKADLTGVKIGITLGIMSRKATFLEWLTSFKTTRRFQVRTDGQMPRGAVLVGPPGSGKSSCFFIPSLVEWLGSALIYDPAYDLLYATGRRRAEFSRVLIFAPEKPKISCHINPIDAVKWETDDEIRTLQSIVKLTLDPSDKAGAGAEAHWIATGSVLLECTLAFLHYSNPAQCNFAGAYNFLSDPRWADDGSKPEGDAKKKDQANVDGVDKALKHMANTPLDPTFKRRWVDPVTGKPSQYNEYIRRSALMMIAKAPNEKSGVVSTTSRFLEVYRDPILAELTSYSDFAWEDLMEFKTPISLYFCVTPNDISRLRTMVRLCLNLSTFAHMGGDKMDEASGAIAYRHPLGQFFDEFAQLGPQEQYMLQLSMVRKYGILPVLGVQDMSQLFAAYGGADKESIMSVMQYKVFMRPTKPETAAWISDKVLGKTTGAVTQSSISGGRFGGLNQTSTESVNYSATDLMTPASVQAFPERMAIVKALDLFPARLETLHYSAWPSIARVVGDRDNPKFVWQMTPYNKERDCLVNAGEKKRVFLPHEWWKVWIHKGYMTPEFAAFAREVGGVGHAEKIVKDSGSSGDEIGAELLRVRSEPVSAKPTTNGIVSTASNGSTGGTVPLKPLSVPAIGGSGAAASMKSSTRSAVVEDEIELVIDDSVLADTDTVIANTESRAGVQKTPLHPNVAVALLASTVGAEFENESARSRGMALPAAVGAKDPDSLGALLSGEGSLFTDAGIGF